MTSWGQNPYSRRSDAELVAASESAAYAAFQRRERERGEEGVDPVVFHAAEVRGRREAEALEEERRISRDLEATMDETEPPREWVMEELLERRERLILTAPEGAGKSTLLQQWAMQVAAGQQPFTGRTAPQRVVLHVDLENSWRHLMRQLHQLRTIASPGWGWFFVASRPDGLDLGDAEDRSWLAEAIAECRPELVTIGPLYKMSSGDPTEEKPAKQVSTVLDDLRELFGFALVLEAHSPHATNGIHRPQRPYGASLWMRWPDFGLHLDPVTGRLEHWRGPREERPWPPVLMRGTVIGGDWPWIVPIDRSHNFAEILGAIREAGKPLTQCEIADAIGVNQSTVSRSIAANKVQYDQACDELRNEQKPWSEARIMEIRPSDKDF
jgi:hypothetical protein